MGVSPHDLKALGTLIARTRAERGLSRDAVGAAAEVDGSTIMRLEHGEFGRPDPEKLQRIARTLGIDAEDLFALAGYTLAGGLPNFGPYLRTKFGKELPAKARKDLERHFEQLRHEHGTGGRGGSAR